MGNPKIWRRRETSPFMESLSNGASSSMSMPVSASPRSPSTYLTLTAWLASLVVMAIPIL